MKFEWETIYSSKGNTKITTRVKVFGGWLVKHQINTNVINMGMIFIPDPEHKWEIDNVDETL